MSNYANHGQNIPILFWKKNLLLHYSIILVITLFIHTPHTYSTALAPLKLLYLNLLHVKLPVLDPSSHIARNINFNKQDLTLFMVYLSADNDLDMCLKKNLQEMAQQGSTEKLAIIVHLDIKIINRKKVTRRYLVLKGKVLHLNANDPQTQQMDSGDPNTLISFCKYCIEHYPAKYHVLILSNHGYGILDPVSYYGNKAVQPSDLFTFNPLTKLYELDRTNSYIDLVESEENYRAICWDDTTGNCLTAEDLTFALSTISNDCLNGKKLDILGFDACLMSMLEIANIAKNYVDIMVASQEVIYGEGWEYYALLASLEKNKLNHTEVAQQMIDTYQKKYNHITADYTLAAITMDNIEALEENVHHVASLLIDCLAYQKNKSVTKMISASRDKRFCTHFDELSYIDLDHFYKNILKNLDQIKLSNTQHEKRLKDQLKKNLKKGGQLIAKHVIANTTGKNLRQAGGISIYFPARRIHPSYPNTPFAKNGKWLSLLKRYHKR